MKDLLIKKVYKLNDIWTLNLKMLNKASDTVRVITDYEELIVLNQYNYILLHIQICSKDRIKLIKKDPSLEVFLSENTIDIYNILEDE